MNLNIRSVGIKIFLKLSGTVPALPGINGAPMHLVNRLIVSILYLLPKSLVRPFAMRYIAGENLEDAVRVLRTLNLRNMMGTVDLLGENTSTDEESLLAVKAWEEVLHSIQENHLQAYLSIKLTQFGLRVDEEFCYANVKNLLTIAHGYNNFVRIDMEDSSITSATLKWYERLRLDGFEKENPQIARYVLQALLSRNS